MLKVKVVPGASRDRVAGWLGDALKVQVSAAPERGKANAAVIELLAGALEMNRSQIELISGQTQARKVFRIHGISEEQLRERLKPEADAVR